MFCLGLDVFVHNKTHVLFVVKGLFVFVVFLLMVLLDFVKLLLCF